MCVCVFVCVCVCVCVCGVCVRVYAHVCVLPVVRCANEIRYISGVSWGVVSVRVLLYDFVGPKAFERNLKATEEWSKEIGGVSYEPCLRIVAEEI